MTGGECFSNVLVAFHTLRQRLEVIMLCLKSHTPIATDGTTPNKIIKLAHGNEVAAAQTDRLL